jgi:hypothetical protein
MSDYNAKNYTEQGGAVTHIGGKLVFDEGSSFEGLPGAVNVPDTTGNASANAAVIGKMLVALKDAGLMAADAWSIAVKDKSTVTWKSLPTPETASNTSHVTAAIADNVITVTLDCEVKDLDDADHGSTWGTHKWFCIGINTGLGEAGVAGVVFDDGTAKVTLTAADDAEASDVGLSSGDFVLYFKAEKLLAQDQVFTLGGLGKKTSYTVKLVETKA